MNMTKVLISAALSVASVTAMAEDKSERIKYNMNQDWEFYRPTMGQNRSLPEEYLDKDPSEMIPSNTKWEIVNIPHSVRLEPVNASGGKNYQGICWYRKRFSTDSSMKNKQVLLKFEGAMQVAKVWLNGKKCAENYCGYLPFAVDISKQLRFDEENIITVMLDNSDNPQVPPGKPQSQLDFTYFGGLYRDVNLIVKSKLHITDEILSDKVAGGGIFVKFPEVSSDKAVVEVQTEIANQNNTDTTCKVKQEIITSDGIAIAEHTTDVTIGQNKDHTVKQKLTVENPLLWHPASPNLYTLRTSIIQNNKTVDSQATKIGIRKIEFKEAGLFINGEKYFALGFNRHQDHPYVGYALPNSANYRDAKKMRDAGFTSFRSHYPHDPSFMDACDELGILCVVSNPGWQFFGDKVFVKRTYDNARKMVRRDRNHPSVFIWEPFPNETHYSEEYCKKLHNIVHEEFPGKDCYTAAGMAGNAQKVVDIMWTREQFKGKRTFAREWGDSVDNWSDQQGRVRVARGWGEMPLLVQALSHAVKLNDMFKKTGGGPDKTSLSGACVWAGIDCYRGYHYQPFYGGAMDLFRLPKFDYYFFQSQRPANIKLQNADSGPMVFIANYGSAYSPAYVTVFSNCDEVRFYENNKLIATQKPDKGYLLKHPPFTFKTKKENSEVNTYYMTATEPGYHYKASEYKAEGIINGKVVATHSVRAPGVPRKILLEADYAGKELTADGSDWVRVYAKVSDFRNTVNPFSDAVVKFSVEGEGEIIGDEKIGANPIKAEAGIATVLIRSTKNAGEIKLKASSFGLETGQIVIKTIKLKKKTR